MIALYIILSVILLIVYGLMMNVMVIFERDKPKNIIIWSLVFLLTQFIGYCVYIVSRLAKYSKKNQLKTKKKEDLIYENLVSSKIVKTGVLVDNDVFNFNSLAFLTNVTANNISEIITDHDDLKNKLVDDILNAKHYVFCELTTVYEKDFIDVKNALIEAAKNNIEVRFTYDRSIKRKLRKEFTLAGVKINKFNKVKLSGNSYSNNRNLISIDGQIAYMANFNISNKQMKSSKDKAHMAIRIRGDIVQNIDLDVRKDSIFASGKYIEMQATYKSEFKNNNLIQFVSNDVNSDLELVLINAICSSKSSIQLHLSQFIPTESIMSLLKYAINSNIEVRMIVPLKNYKYGKYFASRAYAKELALLGANVYLYDGYVNFNSIVIDDEYIITGSYSIDRDLLNTSNQNMLIINDKKSVNEANRIFNDGIDNSYRISNAKYMLLREKFFKNFV